jgi:hypothetical protein
LRMLVEEVREAGYDPDNLGREIESLETAVRYGQQELSTLVDAANKVMAEVGG